MKEYTFDLKMFATLTFEAESEEAARQLMRDDFALGELDVHLGDVEISVYPEIDGEPDLIDVVAL